ncbi:MAG: hypothetical protein GY856_06240 [bacterium]|nr:hypothetical protein [bacterium]
MSRNALPAIVCALALLAIPAFAADVVYSGTDVWSTPADGKTFVYFGPDPIPADFFCNGSKAFTGRIYLGGVPVITDPSGAFGNADTIMARLDKAVFDSSGVAKTRLQFVALSLVSMEPLKTVCGDYDLTLGLTGAQPISHDMTIVREGNGGYFVTTFGAKMKISFTPVGGGKSLDLVRSYTKLHGTHTWTDKPGDDGVQYGDYVVVDTDLDQVPDTLVEGTSNFAVGWEEIGGEPVPVLATTDEDLGGTHRPGPAYANPAQY